MVPLILLCGQAGSGKDTIGNIIAERHNGVCIALADPMKRLARHVFDFTEEQLWGPSECRNAPDYRYDNDYEFWDDNYGSVWDDVNNKLEALGPKWIEDLCPGADPDPLWTWMAGIRDYCTYESLTPRHVLQQLGTEYGRKHLHKDVWVDYAIEVAQKLLGGGYRYHRTTGLTEDPKYAGPDWVVVTDGRMRNEVMGVKAIGGMTVRILDPNKEETKTGHVSETELTQIPDHFFDYLFYNHKSEGLEVAAHRVKFLLNAPVMRLWQP